MINLLPDNEKKLIEHEYKFRHLAVVLMASFIVVTVAAVLLVPAFLISVYKNSSLESRKALIDKQAGQSDIDPELKATIDKAAVLVRVLKQESSSVLPSDIIETLVKFKGDDVHLTDINFAPDPDGTIKVLVAGVADNRQGLSVYTEALSHEPMILKIDVPVSNFAKDSNIDFSFSLSVKK